MLSYLRELRAARNVWVTRPSDVDHWWRQRSNMQLVQNGNEWLIQGEGAERAVVAYARDIDGNLVYELQPSLTPCDLH